MNNEERDKVVNAIKPYFVENHEFNAYKEEIRNRLEKGSNNFTLLNTQMKFILAGIGAIIVMLIPIVLDVIGK